MTNNQRMMYGIIGGAGVKASVELLHRIENAVTLLGAFRDGHHPEIIMWQATSAPSRSMYLEGRGPSFVEDYVSMAKKLKNIGSDKIIMCCNTAHYAIDTISQESGVDIVNLLRETTLTLKNNFSGHTKIGMLCTDGTIKFKLYEKYFHDLYPAAKVIYPEDEYQQFVTEGICQVKDRNDMTQANTLFRKSISHLVKNGANVIVIACTDISVALSSSDFELPYLDTTDVLVDVILKSWQENEVLQFELKKSK